MEFKGTKGKWKVNHLDDIFIESEKGKGVCIIPANGCYDYDTWRQDAKLIASSPDLLEALEHTLEVLYQCDCPPELMETYGNLFMNYNNLIHEIKS